MRSWSVKRGGQSSFDHAHVESLKKIIGESLVCHMGGYSSFDHGHIESFNKILGESLDKIHHVHGQKMIDPPL